MDFYRSQVDLENVNASKQILDEMLTLATFK